LDHAAFEKSAITATNNQKKITVYNLEKIHRNIVKFGGKGEELKAIAHKRYPLSTYFA